MERVENVERLEEKINTHFQKEINLNKEIIDLEKRHQELKFKTAEGYIKVTRGRNSDPNLAKLINSMEDEKDKIEENITSKYNALSNLKGDRKVLIADIKAYIHNDLWYKLLNDYYNYYINLLDNMQFNHRELMFKSQVKTKSMQINELAEQLKYRDLYIKKLKDEFIKKKAFYDFSVTGIRDYKEFSQEPLRANTDIPIINNTINDSSNTQDNKNQILPNINTSNNKPINNFPVNNDRIKTDVNNNNKLKYVNKNKRSFNYELKPIKSEFKVNHPIKLNPYKYSMKLNEFNRDIPNRSINFENSFKKSFYNNQSYDSIINRDTNNTSFIKGKNNEMHKDDVFDEFEKERKRLVKTVLRKNILSRFRGSPYLKN